MMRSFMILTPQQIGWSDQGECREYFVYGREKNACRVLVGKPAGKRPLARPKYRRILYWILKK
jgi:hypothetical protein